MANTLSRPARFFFEHAGYSYDPKTQTADDGRAECAEALAEAESVLLEAMRCADVGCQWENDDPELLGYRKRNPWTPNEEMDGTDFRRSCEQVCIWHRNEDGRCTYLASLGGITDATQAYRRVVRAELALEALADLRRIVDTVTA